jgi:hypothetical protein
MASHERENQEASTVGARVLREVFPSFFFKVYTDVSILHSPAHTSRLVLRDPGLFHGCSSMTSQDRLDSTLESGLEADATRGDHSALLPTYRLAFLHE